MPPYLQRSPTADTAAAHRMPVRLLGGPQTLADLRVLPEAEQAAVWRRVRRYVERLRKQGGTG